MNNNSIKLLIDVSQLCYMSFYTLQDLSINDVKTEIPFGFLNQILSIANKISNQVIFCFDSKMSYRKNIYPDYKANRKKEDETNEEIAKKIQFYNQIKVLKTKILPGLGFKNIFSKNGYESDDIIAYLCKENDKQNFIIASSDQDMYQLLSRNIYNRFVVIYNPKTKKNITIESFQKEYGITPEQWIKVKAIAGCASDNVKGVYGIGEKTAIKYLTNQLNKESKKYIDIINSKDIIRDNHKLVRLPFKKTSNPIKIELIDDKLKKKDFINIFDEYNFKTFLKKDRLDKWIKTFDLK